MVEDQAAPGKGPYTPSLASRQTFCPKNGGWRAAGSGDKNRNMGRVIRSALFAPILLIAAGSVAFAADCGPLTMVNSVPITVKGNRILVPVTLNGAKATFMLDTGGSVSQVTPSLARALKLAVSQSPVKLMDMYGYASTEEASVTFGLGRLQDKTAELHIATRDFDKNDNFDGILAGDYMGAYDIELDLAGGKLNYFSPDHCAARVIYWPAAAIAAVPMLFRDGHMRVTANINGKDVRAIIDTGAPLSSIKGAEAKRLFDVDENTAGNIDAGTVDGKKQFIHIFDTLGLDGIAMGKPRNLVMPDLVGRHDVNNDYVTGSRVHRVDDEDVTEPPLIIGMNMISKLHFFIAFGEKKLYATAASAPAAPAPAKAN